MYDGIQPNPYYLPPGGTGGTGGTGSGGSGGSGSSGGSGGSSMNLTMPDLQMQILGRPGPTNYPTAAWNVPTGEVITLYLDDDGVNPPDFGYVAGAPTVEYGGWTAQGFPNRYTVYVGTFTA